MSTTRLLKYTIRSVTILLCAVGASHAQNLAPIANNDTYVALANQPLLINAANGVLTNDTDPDGGTLIVHPTLGSGPTSGSLLLYPNGSFQFTPTTGFFTPVTFQYRVCDNGIASQLISQFDFSTPSLTTATVGPNATSINPNTAQAACGIRTTVSGGSAGLDLVIPNSTGLFDFTSFKISFAYRDQEGTADIITGGNFRIYHITGDQLGIRINVIDSSTGTSTVYTQNLGNFLAGSNTYTVAYDELTGTITKTINGTTTVYPSIASDFSPLDTALASDVTVGLFMDGSGSATPSLCSIQITDESSLCTVATVTINTSTNLLTNRKITHRVAPN